MGKKRKSEKEVHPHFTNHKTRFENKPDLSPFLGIARQERRSASLPDRVQQYST